MKEIHNNDLKQQLMSESAFKDCFSTDVSADTRLFHFLARDYIVQEGQQPSWLFYLTRGRARLYVTLANGRVSLIDFFAAPCFIGEIELVPCAPYEALPPVVIKRHAIFTKTLRHLKS